MLVYHAFIWYLKRFSKLIF